jgi:hypothetical protein
VVRVRSKSVLECQPTKIENMEFLKAMLAEMNAKMDAT